MRDRAAESAAANAELEPQIARLRLGRPPEPSTAVSSATGSAAPSTARAAPPPTVYNADLMPQLPRDAAAPSRPVLHSGEPATLRFDIGPPWATSVLGPAVPSIDILKSENDVALSVVLVCGFCEPRGDSLKRVTYAPSRGRSNEVQFKLTPKRDPERPTYIGSIELLIINDKTGVEHDRLAVQVSVRDDSASLGIGSAFPAAPVAIIATAPRTTASWQPDVVLYVNQSGTSSVSIEVQPISDDVRRAIGQLSYDSGGSRRTFVSGISDPAIAQAMATSSYGAMTAVAEQGELMKQLSARGADATVSEDSQKSLTLKDGESLKVTNVLAQIGRRLYRHLFVDGGADEDLLAIIERLDAAAAAQPPGRPLRMKIVTNRISLPWQYLNPMGPVVDAQQFWGLRYSLSVVRGSTHTSSNMAADQPDGTGKVVFARYASSADDTWKLAADQIQQLKKIPVDLLEVDSRDRLLNTLKTERRQISAIVTFLHASSGAKAGLPTSLEAEPGLLFDSADIVTSYGLEDLRNVLTAEESRSLYLRRAPLVILNACETGPSMALPHVSLEDAMFQLGARGVVVTEVSVWVQLGHVVATKLIERLARGEAVSDALTAIRRELYTGDKNPLGLLYVYYGDPSATLRN
jgi:hypothetical protein